MKESKTLLLNALRSFNFYIHNSKPTRLGFCLGNILINVPNTKLLTVTMKLGWLDHEGLQLKVESNDLAARAKPLFYT